MGRENGGKKTRIGSNLTVAFTQSESDQLLAVRDYLEAKAGVGVFVSRSQCVRYAVSKTANWINRKKEKGLTDATQE